MTNLRNSNGDRWLVIGDSNVVSSQDEKIGGVPFNLNDARSYFDFVDTLGLIDLSIAGGTFTCFFPKAIALLDIALESDHAPLIVFLKGLKRKYRKDFKFESKWLMEEDCTSTVRDSWIPISQSRNSQRFGSKLRRTEFSLIRWSKLKFRVNNHRKMGLQTKIKSFQGK
ncbi:hypothetical protein V6N11_040042 [Hibiscus sabdariffa]|uniref:RNA-directed DNA polymerase, eukaryota n=1 Tax=Hibiscus sabdariffa TaxID=183260 RepID=A0ABR2RGB2_9ROSI